MESLINKKVEPFTVQAFHNGELKDISEADLQGHWSVIFFYPADFTFVCPTELEDLSDHYDQFRKLNCEIYSVSTDSAYVHKAWADASKSIAKIRYPMLSDSATWLSRFFGVYIEETGQALRGTFIINPQGEIKAYEVHDLGIGRNADELVRKLEAAQFVAEHGDLEARSGSGGQTVGGRRAFLSLAALNRAARLGHVASYVPAPGRLFALPASKKSRLPDAWCNEKARRERSRRAFSLLINHFAQLRSC